MTHSNEPCLRRPDQCWTPRTFRLEDECALEPPRGAERVETWVVRDV